MNIALSIAGWHPNIGGPFRSAGQLITTFARLGHDVSLYTLDYGEGSVAPAPEGVRLLKTKAKLIPGIRQSYIPGAQDAFSSFFDESKPEVIHDNGLWMSFNAHVAKIARRRGIPRLLSTRGTLDSQALRHRAWKKQIALRLGQQRVLDTTDCFHATAEREVAAIRDLGFKQPIALLPNGVDLPQSTASFDAPQTRVALYLGRVHPIKNLEALVNAWIQADPEGWRLKIAGNPEMQYDRVLQKLIDTHDAADRVQLCGPVYGEEKEALFHSAELFFLVSKTENFGISAAEALAYGVPVVASKNTPWQSLEHEGCGWWVDGNVKVLSDAVKIATSSSQERLQQMGIRGRRYTEAHFAWTSIGCSFVETYEWMLGRGEKPDFVDV